MDWKWKYVATHVIKEEYGGYVDWQEGFYLCPECGEPVYRDDYPHFEAGMICPICEAMIEEE